jgi:hypothetical protein
MKARSAGGLVANPPPAARCPLGQFATAVTKAALPTPLEVATTVFAVELAGMASRPASTRQVAATGLRADPLVLPLIKGKPNRAKSTCQRTLETDE